MKDTLHGEPFAVIPVVLITAPITPMSKLVWLCIQSHTSAASRSVAFPSQKKLAEMCHTSVPTVKRSIRELTDWGLLVVSQRHKDNGDFGWNEYTVRYQPQQPPLTGIIRDTRQRPTGITGDPRTGITGDPPDLEPKNLREGTSPSLVGGGPSGAVSRAVRDAVWDAVGEAVGGGAPETRTERSRRGKCVGQLLEVGATPDEIQIRSARYRRKYPGAALTDTALVAHWGELAVDPPPTVGPAMQALIDA